MTENGNALYIQSGGPTAVINASLFGVMKECGKHPEIGRLYGTENGVLGLIQGKIRDLGETAVINAERLPYTPGMLMGSTRYEIDENDPEKRDYRKILKTLKKYGISCLFMNGGNGTVRAAVRLSKFLKSAGSSVRIVVIPKTVDNDISGIDHAPGFPSAARHVAIATSELLRDMETYDTDLIMFTEVMGRNTGFLAGAALAAGRSGRRPDLIYVPERVFSPVLFLEDVNRVLRKKGKCFATVAEGVKTEDGHFLFEQTSVNRMMDMHKNMGGIIPYLDALLRENFQCKIRGIDLGLMQRCCASTASGIDRREAVKLGELAVRAAMNGKSDVMVTVQRGQGKKYRAVYGTEEIRRISEKDNFLPSEYILPGGNGIRDSYLDYIEPLIGTLPAFADIRWSGKRHAARKKGSMEA